MVLQIKIIRFDQRGSKGVDMRKDDGIGLNQVVIYNKSNRLVIPADEWILIAENLQRNLPLYISGSYKKLRKMEPPVVLSDTWLFRVQFGIPSNRKYRSLVICEKLEWFTNITMNEVTLTQRDAELLYRNLRKINDHLLETQCREEMEGFSLQKPIGIVEEEKQHSHEE